jgi:site-specific DNA recombinase
MKAFAYLRVSKVRQELSPEAQRAQLEAYCVVKGYELVHIFEEPAVSGGTSFRERQEGAWLMALLDECDTVIFTKVDRPFRDTPDCLMTVADIDDAGKSLHFLDMGVDTTTAAGEMFLTFMVAMARFERRRISERITEALAVVKAQGRKIGPAPFGYRNLAHDVNGRKVDGGLHEPIERDAFWLQFIFESAKRGQSLRSIAAQLNFKGVPTRRGGQWRPSTVAKIVRRMTQ